MLIEKYCHLSNHKIMPYLYYFMKTDVWLRAIDYNTEIYGFCKQLKCSEGFSIKDQLRRASLSVPKNIAEGLGRESLKEQFQFLGIAYASLMEFISLLVTIEKIGLAEKHVIDKLLNNSEKVAQLINGYRRYLI